MPILIITHKGKPHKCLYDKQDHELISRFSWSMHSKGYAKTTMNGKTILMHRLILGIVDNPEIEVDHRFHNKLDNRRSKIRICTPTQNRRNSRKLKPDAHSMFKGIYRERGRWHAQITQGQRVVNLGRYRSEITAGKVYDQAARETFQEFALLNFPDSELIQQSLIPGF